VEKARTAYCRFGQYSRALDQIRLCLEHKAIERKDLEKMCSELGIPGDFDIAQINWRPEYDPFFYAELYRPHVACTFSETSTYLNSKRQ
jgi:hypothetical protein